MGRGNPRPYPGFRELDGTIAGEPVKTSSHLRGWQGQDRDDDPPRERVPLNQSHPPVADLPQYGVWMYQRDRRYQPTGTRPIEVYRVDAPRREAERSDRGVVDPHRARRWTKSERRRARDARKKA